MDYEIILKKFKTSSLEKREVVTLTFKEGMNILECSELLESGGVCDKKDFLKTCNSEKLKDKHSFLKKLMNGNKVYYLLEGFLFPDTYQFYKNSKSSEVIEKFLNNFEKKVLKSEQFKNLYTTSSDELKKTLIIASIIQAEAANKEDMFNVNFQNK
ncbi:hypothetical protein FACS189465_1760 [Clostridia bacterium]|nr:hypothetical protein FACS189465_1760 [Clostridia bacterium]